MTAMLTRIIPLLHITNAAASEQYYCGQLGFTKEFEVPASATQRDPVYMGVSRDGLLIHLSGHAGDGIAGNTVLFRCDSVDALYREFLAKGVAIHIGPVNQTWGLREVVVRDPDRNAIVFQTPIAG